MRRAVFLIVAVIGLVLALPWHKYLAIREITVEGGERIQAETVLQSLPITRGMNWLTADIQAAREALLRLPDVRDARVKKRLWMQIGV
ncbi:MAG: FtsQ-type POTRA domain-containing protein, partial [Candidatus Bipolaricaulota bacterium]|nr:FtsQ-type POTRA domain-containing protein [Candidatus Bipolaricaulota bacterium]